MNFSCLSSILCWWRCLLVFCWDIVIVVFCSGLWCWLVVYFCLCRICVVWNWMVGVRMGWVVCW